MKLVGPLRDLYFFNLFILFLHTCMFPGCCFRQRTNMAEGLVNGVLNETWTHSCLQFEWFSVGYRFIQRSFNLFLECVYISLFYPSLIYFCRYECVFCALECFWISLTFIFPLSECECFLGIFYDCKWHLIA